MDPHTPRKPSPPHLVVDQKDRGERPMTITILGAQKVPCPRPDCEAKKGEPCKSSNGGLMRTSVHTERRKAALQAKES
jgi:hypothetical protein